MQPEKRNSPPHARPARHNVLRLRQAIVLACLSLCLLAADQGAPPDTDDAPAADDRPFLVFDAMLYKDSPDMAAHGLPRLTIVYAQNLWPEKVQSELPPRNLVRTVARRMHRLGNLICIDIEHWPLFDADNQLRQDNLAKYQRVADWFHAARPGLRLGYYAVLPPRHYQALAQDYTPGVERWRAQTRALEPLAPHVDVVFPSLYTLSDDPEQWQRFARASLEEARRYGKQVYPFLWPHFHDASDRAGELIPANFWQMQLETCRQYADGVVIWGGYQRDWNDDAPWWHTTRAFLKDLDAKR